MYFDMESESLDPAAAVAINEVIAAYPAQEALSALGEEYSARALALGAGICGDDVRYGDDPHQILTIFRPENANGVVLVVFHGGGWTNGYKEWMSLMAPAFNAKGVTLVSATYRLAPKHIFPSGFDDCAEAIACSYRSLLPELADRLCLFVGGHSAGGHYAALLAVTDEWRTERGLPADVLSGCLPISGTYWFGETSGLSMRPRFLGPDSATDQLASPLHRLASAATPPFFISYGSQDFPHLKRQAEVMVSALRERMIPCEVAIIPDSNHFDVWLRSGEADSPWVGQVCDWMLGKLPTD